VTAHTTGFEYCYSASWFRCTVKGSTSPTAVPIIALKGRPSAPTSRMRWVNSGDVAPSRATMLW